MALKNYTSSVPATRSVSFIEQKLAGHGARKIMKEYDENWELQGLMFILEQDGTEIPFQLPARISECERVLTGMLSSRARPETFRKIPDQARRTAWKILSDWVEAQMAMVELAQVDIAEVFFPYIYNPTTKKTLYQSAVEKGLGKFLTNKM